MLSRQSSGGFLDLSVTDTESLLNCSRPAAHAALKALEASGLIAPIFRGTVKNTSAIATRWKIAGRSEDRQANRAKVTESGNGSKKYPRARIGYSESQTPEKPVQVLGTVNRVCPQFPMQELGTLILPEGYGGKGTGSGPGTDLICPPIPVETSKSVNMRDENRF